MRFSFTVKAASYPAQPYKGVAAMEGCQGCVSQRPVKAWGGGLSMGAGTKRLRRDYARKRHGFVLEGFKYNLYPRNPACGVCAETSHGCWWPGFQLMYHAEWCCRTVSPAVQDELLDLQLVAGA